MHFISPLLLTRLIFISVGLNTYNENELVSLKFYSNHLMLGAVMYRKIALGLVTFLLLMSATAAIVELSTGTVSADTSGDYTFSPINNNAAVKNHKIHRTGRGCQHTGRPLRETGYRDRGLCVRKLYEPELREHS